MSTFTRKSALALVLKAALLATAVAAAPDVRLKLPNFESLADKASESVNITLDSALLGIASGFLDPSKPQDAAAKELITGLKGVYVRSYTFDKDFAYPSTDVDIVRKQLSAPTWQRLVGVRSRKEQANVEIYISIDHGSACALAIIASEPREFTIVNIVGSIDLEKLHRLEGKFGIPKLQLEEKK